MQFRDDHRYSPSEDAAASSTISEIRVIVNPIVPRYISVFENEDIKSLDQQLGVHPRKPAPDVLRSILFDEPKVSQSDLRKWGTAADIPDMVTYLVADVSAFPDWESEVGRFTLPARSLFIREAETALGHAAPYLVTLSDKDDFTRRLFTHLPAFGEDASVHHWHRPYGIIIRSRAGFDAVYTHLRRFTKLMDSEGGWYFRRFWEPRHSYFWLPLLTSDLQIAAKFFGRTSSSDTAIFHSISVPNGRRGKFLTTIWQDDTFLDAAMVARLPASHQQILDANYLSLLDRASQRESLEKIVDYLTNAFPARFSDHGDVRARTGMFARDVRELALQLGCSSELGWARFASVAACLGIGFLDDPRFMSRGLSRRRIGHDSQGEKILAIGNACAKDLLPVKARLADRALRDETARIALPQNPSIADVTALLERIDPHCQWTWGESALRAWIRQLLTRPTTAGSSASQAVLAYCHGLGFRDDLSHSYQRRLQATSPVEFDLAVRDIFLNDFEVSPG